MTAKHATWAAAIAAWAVLFWSDHRQNMACLQSGGTVVLGVVQDGCAERPTP